MIIKPIKNHLLFLAFAFLFTATSCKDEPEEPIISTFYLIRHAEKDRTNPENTDPELNQDGLNRALKWAEVFDPVELDAIYSTNYERTTMTAAPVSIKKEIEIEFYDPGAVDIDSFKETHKGQNVLIVGHSNTTPVFVNQLLGEDKYPQMEDDDNSSLFIVRYINDGTTDFVLKMD
ncbi:SixA phosphatase family protein [Flagellimonas meridianipacifica]|uniref:Broad specificity phosphatase PhoE n=1 Tax=Flagellimonas meridianipacifica TaxID=1080225 RepID=A0A2T0MAJ9_9FLAO|nr:phosphoglycerate mutase family protein [Allomuricauda pacifica]PRX54531.1 broad specificity phosphatase PhoE [Allomuricauda pacifica]